MYKTITVLRLNQTGSYDVYEGGRVRPGMLDAVRAQLWSHFLIDSVLQLNTTC